MQWMMKLGVTTLPEEEIRFRNISETVVAVFVSEERKILKSCSDKVTSKKVKCAPMCRSFMEGNKGRIYVDPLNDVH